MGDSTRIICKECKMELKDEWKFCPYCQSHIEENYCSHCGKEIKDYWKFCPHCTNQINLSSNKHVVEKSNEWLKGMLAK